MSSRDGYAGRPGDGSSGGRKSYDVRERINNRFEVDQRAALFGNRYSGSREMQPRGGASAQVLEQQNDEYLDELDARVRAVKEVAHGIGREARESNNILNGMGGQFDKAGNMLKGTMAKLQNMVDSGSGRSMIYLALFVVAMFMLMTSFLVIARFMFPKRSSIIILAFAAAGLWFWTGTPRQAYQLVSLGGRNYETPQVGAEEVFVPPYFAWEKFDRGKYTNYMTRHRNLFYEEMRHCDWDRVDQHETNRQLQRYLEGAVFPPEVTNPECEVEARWELSLDLVNAQGLCHWEKARPLEPLFVTEENCRAILNDKDEKRAFILITYFTDLSMLLRVLQRLRHPMNTIVLHVDGVTEELLDSVPTDLCIVRPHRKIVWATSTVLNEMWSVMGFARRARNWKAYSHFVTITSRDYPVVTMRTFHELLSSTRGQTWVPRECCMHDHYAMKKRWQKVVIPCSAGDDDRAVPLGILNLTRKRWPSPFMKEKAMYCLCNTLFNSVFSREAVEKLFFDDPVFRKILAYVRLSKMADEVLYGPIVRHFLKPSEIHRGNPAAQSHFSGVKREASGKTNVLTLDELLFVEQAIRDGSLFVRKVTTAESSSLVDWIDEHAI
ncbi:hypothetical protein FOZ60_006534 [Perkinsus olseni]|uniref:t-SNARE coiled-coil homology domain-containing protein n=1 Tax=Perkinsus olseni TaxID=32597 RepID=A0A7J6NP68_PEROL|nr:hypothetical protein FOZ60_006534 [Perkinsus olseni]